MVDFGSIDADRNGIPIENVNLMVNSFSQEFNEHDENIRKNGVPLSNAFGRNGEFSFVPIYENGYGRSRDTGHDEVC